MQIKSIKWLAMAALSVLALAGCTTTRSAAPAQAQEATPDYLIGPGDNVNIIVWS
jgi:polysaccharide export outer membrane protein